MVEEPLDYEFGMLFKIAKSAIQSLVYSTFYHGMIYDACEEDFRKTLNTHITSHLYIDAAAERWPKRLLISRSFITHVLTFVSGESNNALKHKKCSTTFLSKEPIKTVLNCNQKCK